jgi:hypothetical protein
MVVSHRYRRTGSPSERKEQGHMKQRLMIIAGFGLIIFQSIGLFTSILSLDWHDAVNQWVKICSYLFAVMLFSLSLFKERVGEAPFAFLKTYLLTMLVMSVTFGILVFEFIFFGPQLNKYTVVLIIGISMFFLVIVTHKILQYVRNS